MEFNVKPWPFLDLYRERLWVIADSRLHPIYIYIPGPRHVWIVQQFPKIKPILSRENPVYYWNYYYSRKLKKVRMAGTPYNRVQPSRSHTGVDKKGGCEYLKNCIKGKLNNTHILCLLSVFVLNIHLFWHFCIPE